MIEWRRDDRPYANGSIGKLGVFDVFTISWDVVRDNKEGPWVLCCKLPGIKTRIANFADQEAAKARAEKVIEHWAVRSGLREE